jgi:glycine dehydrogenase subunit 2
MLMRAVFADRGEPGRNVIITADTAHGTNPASVTMAGFEPGKVATTDRGNLDLEDLRAKVDDRTAGLMLTNPRPSGCSTRGSRRSRGSSTTAARSSTTTGRT